jgi:hypothetical protein
MAKVGGEVDAFCTRCQLLLAHTVIAMLGTVPVKVECNTCRNVHRFRGASTAVKSATRRTPRGGLTQTFEQMLAACTAAPRPYASSALFATGDVIDHTAFGRGFVSGQKDPGKVEVTFRTGVKTLIHGKR